MFIKNLHNSDMCVFGIIQNMGKSKHEQSVYDEPIIHYERPNERSLDLRHFGISCVPRIGFSKYSKRQYGTNYHRHPGCLEICLCLRGNLYFESGGTQYPFFPGRVFVSMPNQPHRMRNNPKGLHMMDMLFLIPPKGKAILNLPASESRLLVKKITNAPVRLFPATSAIRALFPRLFSIHDATGISRDEKALKLQSCVLDLLIAVADAPTAPSERSGHTTTLLKNVIKAIDSNPMAECSLAEMASKAGLSEVAFFAEFKRATGFSPHAFILDRRVKAAQKDLMTGSKVRDVSTKFGFPSPQHFATVFKNITGLTPTQYIAQR